MSTVPKDLLFDLLTYLNSAPVAPERHSLSAILSEDIQWTFPGGESTFVGGTHEGIDAVAELLASIFTTVYKPETFEYEFLNFFGDDEFGTAHYRVKAESISGVAYINEYALIAQVQDGKIIKLWEFLDTAYARAKLFSS